MSLGIETLIVKFSIICLFLTVFLGGCAYATKSKNRSQLNLIQKDKTIEIFITAKNTSDRLSPKQAPVYINNSGIKASITIEPQNKFQQIAGFGGAFTESAAYALSKLTPDKRQEVLKAYFDPINGLGYTLCRTHINSCDFSLENYCYTNGVKDVELKNFSVERDKKLLIPLIRDASAISGDKIKLLASPWSPPAWMKTNGRMNWGGRLKPEFAGAWAKYFIEYIKAYEDEGIEIWGVTVQNEPASFAKWDSCMYSAKEERDFVKNYLGPAIANSDFNEVKIIIWDHNKNKIDSRAAGVLNDPDTAKYVWGTGYHWYSGEYFGKLDKVNKKFADKKLLATEGCIINGPKIGSWKTGEKYGHNILGDLNHYAVGWIDWNIVLDQNGGPNHAKNFCDAPVIADGRSNAVFYNSSFYYLGHFSKFIRPGAVRIGCKANNRKLEATAFLNTDGRIAVVIMNSTNKPIDFTLGCNDEIIPLFSPAHSIQTVIVAGR